MTTTAALARPAAPTLRARPRAATSHATTSRATYVRRRLAVAAAVVVAALGLALGGDAVLAEAGGASPISAGHVVVQPGQSLWDIAREHAPAGTDLRSYLLDLEQLNGVRADAVDAWDVLLLPIQR